jgi:hypothetical protein
MSERPQQHASRRNVKRQSAPKSPSNLRDDEVSVVRRHVAAPRAM